MGRTCGARFARPRSLQLPAAATTGLRCKRGWQIASRTCLPIVRVCIGALVQEDEQLRTSFLAYVPLPNEVQPQSYYGPVAQVGMEYIYKLKGGLCGRPGPPPYRCGLLAIVDHVHARSCCVAGATRLTSQCGAPCHLQAIWAGLRAEACVLSAGGDWVQPCRALLPGGDAFECSAAAGGGPLVSEDLLLRLGRQQGWVFVSPQCLPDPDQAAEQVRGADLWSVWDREGAA